MASAEMENSGDPEFSWGKKRGVGGKMKEVQFYESFTYDGVEYALYDCVYMQNKDREADPHIGKLVKIWGNRDNTRRIKVQWFFRPSEISYWLEKHNMEASDNELFLASGGGKGLANVNPLEAIVGKCNVVCISRDDRNPQPSEEQLRDADYVFYRSFDVEQCRILDKMDDKVGGLEVRFVFNRQENGINTGPLLGSESKEQDSRIFVVFEETLQHSEQQLHDVLESIKEDGIESHVAAKGDTEVRNLVSKVETSNGVGSSLDHSKSTTGKTPAPLADQLTGGCVPTISQKSNSAYANAAREQSKDSALSARKLVAREKLECDPPNLDDKSFKREKLDDSAKLTKSKEKINIEQFTSNQAVLKKAGNVSAEEKTEFGIGKVSVEVDKLRKSKKDSNILDDRPSKKLKVQESVKFFEDEKNYLEKDSISNGCIAKGSLVVGSSAKGIGKAMLTESLSSPDKDTKFTADSRALGDEPSKKLNGQGSINLRTDKDENTLERATTSGSKGKGPFVAGSSVEDIGRARLPQKSYGLEKDIKFNEESKASDYQPLTELKVKDSVNLSENKCKSNLEKVNSTTSGSGAKGLPGAVGLGEDSRQAILAQNSKWMDDVSKEKPNDVANELNETVAGPKRVHMKDESREKMENLGKSSSKLDKGAPSELHKIKLGPLMEKLEEKVRPKKGLTKSSNTSVDKIYGKICDVTQRPDAEKGKWFKSPVIFLERMVAAHREGKLVLLQNLDPNYSSAEVEDMVWSVFKETCTTKVVQRTAVSSPFCGQALVIFNSREAAERVVGELIKGCLIISDRRPIVGSIANLHHLQGMGGTFHGHFEIDEKKIRTRREKEEEKSAAYCCQRNTAAYDLATEWCLLQKQSVFWWHELHKAHKLQYQELKAKFKHI